jgi:hypothetical protein
MIEADKTNRPIWKTSAKLKTNMGRDTYHPGIASATVDKPSRYLTCSLYHQQTAEAFGKLKERG